MIHAMRITVFKFFICAKTTFVRLAMVLPREIGYYRRTFTARSLWAHSKFTKFFFQLVKQYRNLHLVPDQLLKINTKLRFVLPNV